MKDIAAVPPTHLFNRRWLVPIAAAIAASAMLGFLPRIAAADPTPDLPVISAQDLIAKVSTAKVPGVSGDIKTVANFGLPDIGGLSDDGKEAPAFTDFLAGTHEFHVWASDGGNFKLQIPGRFSETDVVHNGNDLWVWQSTGQKVLHSTHSSSPQASDNNSRHPSPYENLTPQQQAQQLLSSIDPTTDLKLGSNTTVAGRAAYDVVLTPKSPHTLVSEVHMAVDGKNYEPLRLQVFAKAVEKPAFSVEFTSVSFDAVNASTFSFTPPKGSTIKTLGQGQDQKQAPTTENPRMHVANGTDEPKFIGDGWDTVVALPTIKLPSGSSGETDTALAKVLGGSKSVSGVLGHGQLVHTSLLNGVLYDNGTAVIGAVDEPTLLAAKP